MNTQQQINDYINSQFQPKSSEMQLLHTTIMELMPTCELWFLDGKNTEGKVISNPNIGYGTQVMHYADGSTKDFYRVGLSGNKTGISVYIMGVTDKTFLAETYGKDLGKASITGYCIKFKSLKEINLNVLKSAIQFGLGERE